MKDYFTPELINTILTLVIIPMLGLVTQSLITFLKRKITDLEQRIDNEAINKYLTLTEDALEMAVISVNQTFVEGLKSQGIFDDAARVESFRLAKEKALTIMGETAREGLKLALGDINTWIETKIEFFVNQNK